MQVATHSGTFHADDVFAIATLSLAHGPLDVVRTRDAAAQAAADLRVDVGGRADAASGDFDHHQRGGAGERANGVRYASFGLVWREHGAALTGDARAAEAIDARLVQGVDANDTGQTIAEPLVDGVTAMSVSGVVAGMNPVWDEDLDAEQEDARFAEAVAFAVRVLERELAGAAAFGRAQALVRDALDRAGPGARVIELDRSMPWHEGVIAGAPEALYVVYPKKDAWALQAVPTAPGTFTNRKDLPAAWAGLTDDALAAATGVDDAVFCHAGRFYASARSRDGVLTLARLAAGASGP